MKSICIKSFSVEKINFLIEQFEKIPMNIYISNYKFKIYENLIVHYTEKDYIDDFYEIVSLVLKMAIEKFYEDDFIKNNIDKNYFYLSTIERSYIYEITKKVLELPDDKIGNKNLILKNSIKSYLLENKNIVIEGFVNFRIKEYKELIERIIEVSVISYLDLITF